MAKISASIKRVHFKTEIHSLSGNSLISDEPASVGGQNLGFSPSELLASSLAACTSATLRMYADRKGWELDEVKVEVELRFIREENRTEIDRKIELLGNLDVDQRKRLAAIAQACPVHKMLSNPIGIQTSVENPEWEN